MFIPILYFLVASLAIVIAIVLRNVKLKIAFGAFGVILSLIAMYVIDTTEYQPRKLYECPCEVEELVVDQIRHYSKLGDTTVTTIISLDNCTLR